MASLATLDVQSVVTELAAFMEKKERNVKDIGSSFFQNQKVCYIQNDLKKGNIKTKDELVNRIQEAFGRAGVSLEKSDEYELARLLKYID